MGLTGCLLAAVLAHSSAGENIEGAVDCKPNTLLYEESTPNIDYKVDHRIQSEQQFSFSDDSQNRLIELIDDGLRWDVGEYEFELNHGRMGKHNYNPNPFGFRKERKPHEPKGPRGIYFIFEKEF